MKISITAAPAVAAALAILGLTLATLAPLGSARAQTAATPAQTTSDDITVTRDNTPAQVIHHADWSSFRRIETTQKDRDGASHVYSGVAVSDLLQKAGVPMGK
ncbi:MAG TPA: hypothetical protein VL547_03275, partial [Dinghuibacter sp.]|nr:hypothetical protein [Dinghuibacter sp.]